MTLNLSAAQPLPRTATFPRHRCANAVKYPQIATAPRRARSLPRSPEEDLENIGAGRDDSRQQT